MFTGKINFFIVISVIIIETYSLDENVPSVLVNVLVRNKAHTLPYFLSSLYNLEYPKSRLSLLFQTDNNLDKSPEILKKWVDMHLSEYYSINVAEINTGSNISSLAEWNTNRFKHVIKLREDALKTARSDRADFLFMLDADVFFVNRNVLQNLIEKNLILVAPMLKSEGVYSNFWCGMTVDFYYQRTEEYKPILERAKDKIGCHEVPMIHSAVLIDIGAEISKSLTYNPDNIEDYTGPLDDIITFAISAKKNDVKMHVCNDKKYGYVTVPLDEEESLIIDKKRLTNVKLQALSDGFQLDLNEEFKDYIEYPKPHKFGYDQIYMINLKRRKDRHDLRMQAFKEIGMDVVVFEAMDGQNITKEWLQSNNINLMKEYEDTYHKRPIKMGEIGCFLSHYYVWLNIIRNNYENTLVLEDDIRFEPFFVDKLNAFNSELHKVEWDLVYIGRKILDSTNELYVTDNLVIPNYSYWTLGYAITLKGAKKLVDAEPLKNLLPVDEFLPIMYNKHPNDTWSKYFPKRNLIALSAAPLLIHPTHYTGQEGYISDTEDSIIFSHYHNEL